MKTNSAILILLAATFANSLFAQQPGDLDSTFGGGGKVLTDITGEHGAEGAIQPDGFIVVAGSTTGNWVSLGGLTPAYLTLVRYNPKGALDNSFGTNGIAITQLQEAGSTENSVVIQPDGKIVAAANYYFLDTLRRVFAAVRYHADGTPDSSFDHDGMVLTRITHDDQATGIALQPDGKILVAGWGSNFGSFFEVVRYNPDGSLDSSFSDDGIVTTQPRNGVNVCSAIALQDDGKIVLGGYASGFPVPPYSDGALIRYMPDGSLDSSFGSGGMVFTDIGSSNEWILSLAIQPDGKIVGSGFLVESNGNRSDIAVVRYNTDGSLDRSFSGDGIVTTGFGYSTEYGFSVAIQADGKIVVGGHTNVNEVLNDDDFALVRYNADGSLDNSFGTNGKVTTDFAHSYDHGYYVGIQPNGRIVMAGTAHNGTDYDFALARYIAEFSVGVIEFSSAENVLFYPNPIRSDEVLEYTLQQDEVLSIALYNTEGKVVQQFITNENRSKGNHKEALLFNDLPGGNYLLTISNGKGSESIKVMKP